MLNTFVKKILAAVLVFALMLSVVPGVAMTAQAAEGDVSSAGYVLFEETFDGTKEQLLSGYTYTNINSSRVSIRNGILSFSDYTANDYLEITLSDLRIPAPSKRCYVGLKMELDVSATTKGRNAIFQIAAANGVSPSFTNTEGTVTAVISTADASATGYLTAGEISSLKLRIGARPNANGGTVAIEGVKISLVMGELGTSVGQDLGRFLECKDGFFQLKRDLDFSSYNSSTGAEGVKNLVTGSNAVLDLNGYTLTLSDADTKLNIANNAKIVDTSAGKTGKIVCDKGDLVIANTAHSTLPVYTGSGYVFTEPKLIEDTHIMAYAGAQTADKVVVHFRPGFGELGGVNVREAYLAGGNSGISMSAFITSKDIYGNETAVTYNSSEEIKLDNMFNGMYAVPEARGEMSFVGFEKYESLEITLKLISDTGAACILPTYTVNNDKVTKHYASADELQISGNYIVDLESKITTGTGKLIMEFDANVPSVMTTNNSAGFGFENRGTAVGGSNRYYVFSVGNWPTTHHYIGNKDIAGEAHVRLEIDLATFATVCKVDGVAGNAVAPDAAELANFVAAWNNKNTVIVSGSYASQTVVLDKLMIYTIETA